MKQAKFFIGMMVFFVTEKAKSPYVGGGTVNGIYLKKEAYYYEITNSAGKIENVAETDVFGSNRGADALAEFTVRCTPAPVETEAIETEAVETEAQA